MSAQPAAFHVLAKPTGAICNLNCKYCFFLSKEVLYPGDRFRMSDELLRTGVAVNANHALAAGAAGAAA
jgi:uncharacterized protein